MNTTTLTTLLDTAHNASPDMSSKTSSKAPFIAPLAAGGLGRDEPRPWRAVLRLLLLTSALSCLGGAMLAVAVLDRLAGGDAPPPPASVAAVAAAAGPAAAGGRGAGIPSADNEFFGREATTDEASGSY